MSKAQQPAPTVQRVVESKFIAVLGGGRGPVDERTSKLPGNIKLASSLEFRSSCYSFRTCGKCALQTYQKSLVMSHSRKWISTCRCKSNSKSTSADEGLVGSREHQACVKNLCDSSWTSEGPFHISAFSNANARHDTLQSLRSLAASSVVL